MRATLLDSLPQLLDPSTHRSCPTLHFSSHFYLNSIVYSPRRSVLPVLQPSGSQTLDRTLSS